ncbi:hypothetical protein PO909_031768 [Leuciscus waleckii]
MSPDSAAAARPQSPLRSAELQTAAFSSTAPPVSTPFLNETGVSVSMLPSMAQAQPPYNFPVSFSNLFPCPWPAAPPPDSSARLPQLESQAQTPFLPPQLPSFPTFSVPPQAPGVDPSVRLPPQTAPAPGFFPPKHFSPKSFSFHFVFRNADAHPAERYSLEPPPVASNIRAQILTASRSKFAPLPQQCHLLRSRRSSITPSKLAPLPQQCHLLRSRRSYITPSKLAPLPQLCHLLRSRRSSITPSKLAPLPQQCHLLRSRRSSITPFKLAPLPQQCLLLRSRRSSVLCPNWFRYLKASRSKFGPLPQQCHPLRSRRSSISPSKLVHCRSSVIYSAPAGA